MTDFIQEKEKQDAREELYEIKISPLNSDQEPPIMSFRWIRQNPGVQVAQYEDKEGNSHFYRYEHTGEVRYKTAIDSTDRFPEHILLMEDIKMRRKVIAKASGKKIGGSSWMWANLVPEAQKAGEFQDPNIVTIYDFAANKKDELFVIMEYLPNGNLLEWLKRRHSPNELSNVIEQLSSVLERIHTNHKLIYADLKPLNIGFDKDWILKLMDFEISVRMNKDGIAIGGTDRTFGFAAPEQFDENPRLSVKTDVYSLGAVTFSVLTGIGHDFESKDLRDKFEKDFNSLIPFREDYAKIFSSTQKSKLSWLLRKALKNDPNERFSTAAEFNKGFQEALAG